MIKSSSISDSFAGTIMGTGAAGSNLCSEKHSGKETDKYCHHCYCSFLCLFVCLFVDKNIDQENDLHGSNN